MPVVINFDTPLKGLDIIESGLIRYLASAPEETLDHEHELMIARRAVYAECRRLEVSDILPIVLTEPSLWEQAHLQTHPPKAYNQIKYETARLLSESGFSRESIVLYNQIIDTEKHPSSQLSSYAKDWSAVALQNIGLYHQAEEKLSSLIIDLNDNADFNILYFVYKHYATLLRRKHFDNLSEHSDTIFEYLKKAKINIPKSLDLDRFTYHLDFSAGYIYYLLNQNAKAYQMYESCNQKLLEINPHKNEYYLLYIKYALCLMKCSMENVDIDSELSINQCINKFQIALEQYPNYKSGLNDFLLTIIEIGKKSGGIDPNQTIALRNLLKTPEDLYCIEADIHCIVNFYRLFDKGANALLNVLEEARQRFNNFSSVVNSRVADVTTTDGVAVCFDLRNSTLIMKQKPTDVIGIMNILRDKLYKYFIGEFDIAMFNGDGFILIRYLRGSVENIPERDESTGFILAILNKLSLLLDELQWDKINGIAVTIGVGISCGKLFIPTPEDPSIPIFGSPINHSKRMCDMAKPKGIVIHYSEKYLDKSKINQAGDFEEIDVYGKNPGEEYSVLYSPQVTDIIPYKFIYRTDKPHEKRIFIQYGKKCSNSCIYCLTDEQIHHLNTLDISTLEDELDSITVDGKYLFSIGHLNESLDDNNLNSTVHLVRYLLGKYRDHPIQIATKVAVQRIEKFYQQVKQACNTFGISEDDINKRLYILYSLCSVNHAIELEDRKVNLSEALDNFRHIIPYIKPFLPGITNRDKELLNIITRFDTIIIGYPYLSVEKMRALSIFCSRMSINCNDSYNFYRQYKKLVTWPGGSAPLSHPSLFSKKLYPFNYAEELNEFAEKTQDMGVNVFRSSPCAIAFLRNETCYTHIGHKHSPIKSILCYGGTTCPNISCSYNRLGYHK